MASYSKRPKPINRIFYICNRNCRFICFWVFDILCMNNRNVCYLSLLDRLHLIRTWVTNPLNQLINIQKLQLPFHIRMKPMYTVDQTYFVWNEVVKSLTHESDGLIFTPVHDPYILGPCLKLLKWKPLEFNSADFKIGVVTIRNCFSLSFMKISFMKISFTHENLIHS